MSAALRIIYIFTRTPDGLERQIFGSVVQKILHQSDVAASKYMPGSLISPAISTKPCLSDICVLNPNVNGEINSDVELLC